MKNIYFSKTFYLSKLIYRLSGQRHFSEWKVSIINNTFRLNLSVLNLYYPSWTSNFQTLKWMMKGCLQVWTVHCPYKLLSNFSILFCSGWIQEKCFSDNSKTIESDSCCFLVSSLSFYHHFIPWSSSPMQFYDQLQ